MNKFKKIIFILFLILIILVSCYRIDSNVEQNISEKSSDNNQSTYKTDYSAVKTENYNGTDYAISRSPAGKYGGQIVASSIGEGPKTFNPWTSKDATSSEIGDLMYDSLLTTDPDTGEVIPKLAKELTVSQNQKVYTIKLRQGVKWSDGKEITADDVVFTWNEIILAGFGNTSLRDSVLIDGEYPKVKKLDKYTVEFTIKQPFAPFQRFVGTQIAPAHIFAPVVKKGKRFFDTYLGTTINPKDIVASGAFLLEEYVPAQRVILKRNPNYYAMDENKNLLPYIDKYVILIVGDLNNELLKFEAGELDVISVRGKDLPRFKEKEKKSNFKIYNLGPNTGTMFIAFNLNTRKDKDGKYYVKPIKQKWFNDLNFRTAIDYAIDRKAMVNNVANGAAQPLFTAESLSSIFLNENLASGHEKDLEYAKSLLHKSGFYLDKKGNLHDKEGNEVEFDLYTNAGQTEREACGVMIKEDLKDLGIKVNFKPIEFNSLVSKLMSTSDWDMILIGLTGSPLEPHSGKNVWYSKGHLHLFNMRFSTDNETALLPWEKELDEIIEQGALELDYDKRKIIYDKYQQIVYDQRPIIYLYSPLTITAVRNKIKNLHPTPLGGTMHNLDELYIDNNY
ncbi:MAG: ABC transporter substrate-binding protein [Candidatus Gastranaerophilales bacterium]|nr:ABC transporter substrate-binding protein [Candidatus Gastranaerophilales bacterium]